MSKHTKGPWILVETKKENIVSHWHIQLGEQSVNFFPYKRFYSEDRSMSGLVTDHEQMANARLIAAAPELLEALEALLNAEMPDCVELLGQTDSQRNAYAKAHSAIAKAKGEQ